MFKLITSMPATTVIGVLAGMGRYAF